MGKRGNGSIRLFLILCLLGLVGYNTWEISQLKAEIARLHGDTGSKNGKEAEAIPAGDKPAAASTAPPANDPKALIADAGRHASRAKELMRRGDFGQASRELQLATQETRRAGADAGEAGEKTLTSLRDSARQLADRAQAGLSSAQKMIPGGNDAAAPAGSHSEPGGAEKTK